MFIFVSQQTIINMANLHKVQRLTFIEDRGKDKAHNFLALYKCECGNERIYAKKEVNNMRKTACGCRRAKEFNQYTKTHGLRSHPLYKVWQLMKERCNNKQSASFTDYGKRGIKICKEWNSITAFVKWGEANGYQKGLQLDRREVNGNYTPDNCRWVTRKINANNTRRNRFIEFNGKRQTLQQWADETGINAMTIRRRLEVYKYSIETALTKPVKFK